MNETTMTVVGNVVDTPKLRRTKSGHWVANFRVASTARRFDREKAAWIDASTLFVNVTAWRALAENIGQSVHKGQPVIASGRYYQREYTVDEQPRTSYELEASAVGHDLTRGVAAFERMTRPQNAPVDLDEQGIPADPADHIYDFAGSETVAEVDLETGEVRDLAPVS
jgi:single-strand DNA-binding protein